LSIVLADVTGHGIEAAIPNVLFGGMLDNMMDSESEPVELCTRLNSSLYRSLDPRTFVCFSMGVFDNTSKVLNITNGGCPYPYHYDAESETVREIEIDAFPLGVRKETEYSTISLPLESGDRIVFCSDGLIETSNEMGEIYGFDRMRLLVEASCRQGLSNRELIDQLIGEVDLFCDGHEQEDDQTLVVIQAN